MLKSRIQEKIPERLSHYTRIEALKSILSDKEGKGICLWAFSNRCKNDDQEIRMGEYMPKRVKGVLPTNASLLNRFGGYENSASISFMEGEVNQHMLKEYGRYRLEFDLREIGVGVFSGGFVDCEYVAEENLDKYADKYCEMISSTFKSIPALQEKYGKFAAPAINKVSDFIKMELDIMGKVFSVKEEKWSEEKEWRKVFLLKPNGDNTHYFNEKPYIKFYLNKTTLTGITVFCSAKTLAEAQKDADDIADFITERGYNAKVRVELFEKRGITARCVVSRRIMGWLTSCVKRSFFSLCSLFL